MKSELSFLAGRSLLTFICEKPDDAQSSYCRIAAFSDGKKCIPIGIDGAAMLYSGYALKAFDSAESFSEYLRFFLSLETKENFLVEVIDENWVEHHARTLAAKDRKAILASISEDRDRKLNDGARLWRTVLFGDAIYKTSFFIDFQGNVTIEDDDQIVSGLPFSSGRREGPRYTSLEIDRLFANR